MSGMSCSICEDPLRRGFVTRAHLDGKSFAAIEVLSKQDPDVPNMKRETVGKHVREHLSAAQNFTPATTAKKGKNGVRHDAQVARKAQGKSKADVATLVQAEVVRKLELGEARVTVQHGLQAQQLLDRRDERQKDRVLAITLARLLHTQAAPESMVEHRAPEALPEGAIEGAYVEVEAEG